MKNTGRLAMGLVFAATVAQLAVGAFAGLQQFEGKAFGARLAFYPVMMLLAPVLWWVFRGRRPGNTFAAPWWGFALIMLPFFIDVTGNTLDLYDTLWWWDDANHFVNWVFLCAGVGLLMVDSAARPPWTLGLIVLGVGALLAILWELAEWYTFIRHGTEKNTAYEDTLGDEALGTLGGAVAALIVWQVARRRLRSAGS